MFATYTATTLVELRAAIGWREFTDAEVAVMLELAAELDARGL